MFQRKFDPSQLRYHAVDAEKGVAECLIPMEGTWKVGIEVRCDQDVMVSVVSKDGEVFPLETGKIIRWSGKIENCSAVQIAANTGFWYLVQKQGGWFETVDPTPHVVALEVTQVDTIRAMIDERLRAFKVSMEMERELTEDEKDEFVLDLVNGDLEFLDTPDEFGLGYEERLKEFNARVEAAKQSEAGSEEAPKPGDGGQPDAAGNGSSTT